MYWGLIPFRQGSQRVKFKNIRLFNGKPLAWYSVNQALGVDVLNDSNLIVATDIHEMTASYFIPEIETDKVLFYQRRPVSDRQPASAYINEIIKHFPVEYSDDIILLQPTCPCREPGDIEEAIEIYELQKLPTLVSVCKASSFARSYAQIGDGVGKKLLSFGVVDEKDNVFVRNSSIYIFRVSYFLEHGNIFSDESSMYIMPDYKSIDINTDLDFKIAEFVYKNKFKGGV